MLSFSQTAASRYSLTDGASSFSQQARGATFDLTGDEVVAQRKKRELNWDKKKKKFIKGDGVGADNVKLVRTENGTRLPATYRSGRFDEWKAQHRVSLPRIGETENAPAMRRDGRRFKHDKTTPAKPLDKRSIDYERKARQLKKREEDVGANSSTPSTTSPRRGNRPGRGSRYGGKPIGKIKSELKTREQIRKARRVVEQRKAKNARPSGGKKGKKIRR